MREAKGGRHDRDIGREVWSGVYWGGALSLVFFGLFAFFSFGLPLLFIGITLVVLGPFRHRPRVFWPGLAGSVSFLLAFLLVVPWSCRTTPVLRGQGSKGPTTCSNLVGIPYSGIGDYRPSYMPAFVAGLVSGAIVAFVTKRAVARRNGGSTLAPFPDESEAG